MQPQAFQTMPGLSGNVSSACRTASPCSPLEATEAAELLFGCYRTGGAAEPEIFVAGVAAVLADYPLEVVSRVVDPRCGLPRRATFLPSIAEVAKACEAEMEPLRREAVRRARLEEAGRLLATPTPARRPTLNEIHARFGKDYGICRERGRAKPGPRNLEDLTAEAAGLTLSASEALRAVLRPATHTEA